MVVGLLAIRENQTIDEIKKYFVDTWEKHFKKFLEKRVITSGLEQLAVQIDNKISEQSLHRFDNKSSREHRFGQRKKDKIYLGFS